MGKKREEIKWLRDRLTAANERISELGCEVADLTDFAERVRVLRNNWLADVDPQRHAAGVNLNWTFPDAQRVKGPSVTPLPPEPVDKALDAHLADKPEPRYLCYAAYYSDDGKIVCNQPLGHDRVKHPSSFSSFFDHANPQRGVWWNKESLARTNPQKHEFVHISGFLTYRCTNCQWKESIVTDKETAIERFRRDHTASQLGIW